jgi:hypothetical protein
VRPILDDFASVSTSDFSAFLSDAIRHVFAVAAALLLFATSATAQSLTSRARESAATTFD